MTLAGRLKEVATTHPMRVALVFEGRKYTYKEFYALTAGFAAGIRSLGVASGGRVALRSGGGRVRAARERGRAVRLLPIPVQRIRTALVFSPADAGSRPKKSLTCLNS